MRPSFNTTGPCFPGEHYMLPPGDRLGRVLRLVDEGKYFTLHAGRQTGKTTCLQWLVEHLNEEGRFHGVWVDIQTARENPRPAEAFKTVLEMLDWGIRRSLPALPLPAHGPLLENPSTAIVRYLRELTARCPRPLVVLFDEADGLMGDAMVSFLTQLRYGYIDRVKTPFPHSIALVGMRQVRDYALSQEERQTVAWLGTTSPFNITAEAATLASFTREQVAALLGQHTEVTGQRFEAQAVERIFELSEGQPWLVNALADQIVNRDLSDRSAVITAAHVEAAKETIILERRTHIDSLAARLREGRVRAVIGPLLEGSVHVADVLEEDYQYVRGLGLIAADNPVRIANPIYREVIARVLAAPVERVVTEDPRSFVLPDGRLDMDRLLTEFAAFWREHGEVLEQGLVY
ncbi:MAG TPA: AAA-like domain-containing protein, partial [Candidatus Nanopelagicales bacterium]|nr:AAA-like domain-containing protein [Candidatus Nanopelagicales bacterium]